VSEHGVVSTKRRTYTAAELADLAEGLRGILGAIEEGSLAADAGTISRLEGAVAALQALAEGKNL
jgi:hypothetical protein